MQRQHESWERRQESMQDSMRAFMPLSSAFVASRHRAQIAALQEATNAAWQLHACSHAPHGETLQQSCLPLTQTRNVTYVGLDFSAKISVPEWTCACCNQLVSPDPLAFGCFPATPKMAWYWYDQRVLVQYKRLGLNEGCSATGFLRSLRDVHTYGDARSEISCIKAHQFEETFTAFLAVTTGAFSLEALGIPGGDTGPYGGCRICRQRAGRGVSSSQML
jgi:hypothetical protein